MRLPRSNPFNRSPTDRSVAANGGLINRPKAKAARRR
jgi:hypothetical protein